MSFKRFIKIVLRWSAQLSKYLRAWLWLRFSGAKRLGSHIWLITEKSSEARDNGFCFFSYLRTKHPEINAYYAISADSPDRHKVEPLGNVIEFNSLEHYAAYLAADFSISSQSIGAHPAMMRPEVYRLLTPLRNRKQKAVFLQHGVTQNKIARRDWHYASHMLDLFVVSGPRERAFMEENYGYPPGYVRELGMCRFDRLLGGEHRTGKTVLIMPTWRGWLRGDGSPEATAEEKAAFRTSEFYSTYMGLLSSSDLEALLERYGYRVIFYPHYALQCFADAFMPAQGERIRIATREHYDVQQLLIDCDLLITDYSSVFFDFAYLKKPEIFFQFDVERFRSDHYAQGFFSYADDGFGPICGNREALLRQLEEYLRRDCAPEEKYLERVDAFFTHRDNKNCERTYEAIRALRDTDGDGF